MQHGAVFQKVNTYKLPMSIWAVSLAAFFLNFSSVIVFVCSPILFTKILGFTDKGASVLEGTVEGFALIVRAFAGMISDALFKRKVFLMSGYAISIISRFLFAPATISEVAIAARWLEKLGNGLQASPREAFISDIAPPHMLGQAFGLNKAMSMSGSFAGSLLLLYLCFSSFDVRKLLWIASFVGLFSMFILFFGVKDPKSSFAHHDEMKASVLKDLKDHKNEKKKRNFFGFLGKILKDFSEFPASFWKVLCIICIFKLGYFSGNFLMLELSNNTDAVFLGRHLFNNKELANSVFSVLQCASCSILAYPLCKISDHIDRIKVVAFSFIIMICSLLCFVFATSSIWVYTGIVLYGLQMSMQGALLALLSSTMPHHLHGTGFGIFFFSTGLSVIFTNNILMKSFETSQAAFMLIACCVGVAVALLPWVYAQEKK